MEDYIKKFNDAIDSHIVMLDGAVITKKNKEILEFYRNLEGKLKGLLVYSYYEAIDYDKVIEVLVQEYLDFINYLIEFILKDRMSWGETLEEKVEVDMPKRDNEPTKDEEPKEPIKLASKPKPVAKKKKPVKKK